MIYILLAIFVLMGVALFLALRTQWKADDLKTAIEEKMDELDDSIRIQSGKVDRLTNRIDAMEPVKIIREKEKKED